MTKKAWVFSSTLLFITSYYKPHNILIIKKIINITEDRKYASQIQQWIEKIKPNVTGRKIAILIYKQ